jgi:hypothetical protein
VTGDFACAVLKWRTVRLTDDGEKLINSVVCVYSDDFTAEIFEFDLGFWSEIFEVYAQNDTA